MCGFAGIFVFHGEIDQKLLEAMTASIKHRGPDDEGYLLINTQQGKHKHLHGADSSLAVKKAYPPFPTRFKANLGLGFRRLAILDLSEHGHQPMSLDHLHIVFNGEIYNHRELREELRNAGCVFRSSCDTEVILAAYKTWGSSCVKRFIGMWSFAIWNDRDQELFCSRDPFGVKPFYYAHTDAGFWFGSELKQLHFSPVAKDLNTPMIWRSMKINAMLVYDEETYWQNYFALKPGHNLVLREAKVSLEQYYTLDPQAFESYEGSLEQAVERYRELFFDSIRLQMSADVEVGSCLSGGLDSSAIVCHATSLTDRRFQTFSSYYAEDKALDERVWIKRVTESTNSISHLVSPDARHAQEWFDDATFYNDLPLGAGFVSQYAVMKLAGETGIKVLLDGQGSDELTAGYVHANYRYFADLLRAGKLNALGAELPFFLKSKALSKAAPAVVKILLSAFLPESELYKLEFSHYRFEPFNRAFCQQAREQSKTGILAKVQDMNTSRLSNFLFNMMHVTSIQTLLHYEDRMSMAHSVESRVPFLDHRLVEFAFSLPSAFKIRPPEQKYIHRLAIKDKVPSEIFDRKDKAIFSAPFYSRWMRTELKPLIEDIFSSKQFRHRGIYNLPAIMSQWQQYLKGSKAPAEMIFSIIALEKWFRCHVDPI